MQGQPDPPIGRTRGSRSEIIDRSRRIKFNFEGKTIEACEGDTVASALYASGVRIFGRSFKYHRARGLLCVSGKCPNCMMNIDGKPNLRACVEPARQGAVVKHQNAWPSLKHDLFSMIEKIGRFMPVGFYYKTFINFPWPWHRVEGMVRNLTGLGTIEEELERWNRESQAAGHEHLKDGEFEHEFVHAEVAVVGGGPAGILAAREAARLSTQVVMIDDQERAGGHLRYSGGPVEVDDSLGESGLSGLPGHEVAANLAKSLSGQRAPAVLSNATVFGLYESNMLGIQQGKKMIKLRAKQLIIATGAYERLALFEGNDLPGVILSSGMQRLTHLYGVRPGTRVVIITDNGAGLKVAADLADAGISVSACVDSRTVPAERRVAERLAEANVELMQGYVIKEAVGKKQVRGVVLAKVDETRRAIGGSEKKLDCDLVCLAGSPEADIGLLTQAGCRAEYDELLGEFVVPELRDGLLACGDVTGIHDLNIAMLQGKVAGLQAGLNLVGDKRALEPSVQHARSDLEIYSRRLQEAERRYKEMLGSGPSRSYLPSASNAGRQPLKKAFACVCEDVVEKDVVQAIFEGFDDMETLKRFSTLSMGPCQGKMCLSSCIALCARETGRSIGETGRTASRPPLQPVPIGVLAGPGLHPTRLTPIHYKHLELGATMMDMGVWKRPHVYSSVEDEYKGVRERVGIIDVSTLGRLDVRGKDAPRILDFVYTHVFSKLPSGRIRYGLICDDAGTILDDGTVTRLSDEHYFITTTTSNIDFVEQWLSWWAAALKLDVYVTNLTAGLAAVNVAGPKARDLLRKLTNVDLSTEAFPYMSAAEGLVSGVPCIMLRIGFVGETGWEIHYPAEYGEYFWDSLMEAGREFNVKPFGVETQRVLRLEKKHIIVSQDTDALSSPYEADMSWSVKLEKEDFIGKAALREVQARGPERKLSGFVMRSQVAHDGDQVFASEEHRPIGVVTSSRFSPFVGKCVGMALLPPEVAKEGSRIRIMTDGKLTEAEVTLVPFYDAEGKRLRS